MFNLRRIYLALRAYVAELPVRHYLTGPAVLILLVLFIRVVSSLEGSFLNGSGVRGQYVQLSIEPTASVLAGAFFVSLLIVGLSALTKLFKADDRRVQTLSLPLSNAERAVSIFLLVGVVLPAIVFLGIWLLVGLGSLLAPAHYLLPPLAPVYPNLLAAYLSYLLILLFFSSIVVHSPRRGGWAVLIAMILIPSYGYLRERLTGRTELFPDSPHNGPEFVGLPISNNMKDGVPDWFIGLQGTGFFIGIVIAAALFAASFFLTVRYRQT